MQIIDFRIVKIGKQEWMAENLNVDHYRNGDPIPQVSDPKEWVALTTGAWCYYQNEAGNESPYGKLYNWHAVNDPRGLAPDGWRVPSYAEWQTLVDHWGGKDMAVGKAKDVFFALSGGLRYGGGGEGRFDGMGQYACFWSSTESDSSYKGVSHFAYILDVDYGNSKVDRGEYAKDCGVSVRCVLPNHTDFKKVAGNISAKKWWQFWK